ncbi:MAG: NF038122 family metalloprotease [Roseiarcus sp.]|jgi:hypothetical protein
MTALSEFVAGLLQQESGSGYPLPPGYSWIVSDTAANIEALTPAEIVAAPSAQASAFAATDGSVVLTVAQALAFETASLSIAPPPGGAVILADAAANLEALKPAEIAGLESVGVTGIAATDAPAAFGAAQIDALGGAAIAIVAPPDDPGQNDGVAVVAGPNGDGMTFDISWDSSVASAPAAFKTDVEEAFRFYADTFVDPTALHFNVGYGEIGGAALGAGDLGASDSPQLYSQTYAGVAAALGGSAQSAGQREAAASLPAADPTGGGVFWMTPAEASALGLGAGSATSFANPDGNIGFSGLAADPFNYSAVPNQAPAPGQYDFLATVEHEISEVMGRVSYIGDDIGGAGASYSPMDLFRYSAPGALALSASAAPAYFSIDGGATNLGPGVAGQPPLGWNDYGAATSDGGDRGDWGQAAGAVYAADAYDQQSEPGVVDPLSAADIALMNAIGWEVATPVHEPGFASNPPGTHLGGGRSAPAPTALPVTVGQLLLDLAQNQIAPASGDAPAGAAYVVADSAFALESLTPQEITAARAIGVGELYSTNASVALDPAQAGALGNSIAVVVPAGDIVSVIEPEPACFCAGTLIATPHGQIPVEALAIGAAVVTASGELREVRWIGRRQVVAHFADPMRAWPVRIRAGALADGVPARDLRLSPDHAVCIDGILIQVGALVNGTSIVRETAPPPTFAYYHVELADHALILAENTPAETFVDNPDRRGFDNWREHETLYPGGAPIVEMARPRAKSQRQAPRAIRERLMRRARLGAGEADAAA